MEERGGYGEAPHPPLLHKKETHVYLSIMETPLVKKIQNFSLETLSGGLRGERVILRIDTNTSLGEEGRVDKGEEWRILKMIPTIRFLQEQGARTLILAHQGRDPKESLRPIYDFLSQKIPLSFAQWNELDSITGKLKEGESVLLENVRSFREEKEDNPSFLIPLISWADLYINEAFSVSHRKHASVHAIAQLLPSYFGFQFVREVRELSRFLTPLEEGERVLILGGAKFGTKLPLIELMLKQNLADFILLGGALANVFLKEKGIPIGDSYYDDSVDVTHIMNDSRILFPIDFRGKTGEAKMIEEVGDDAILDIGPKTEELFHNSIQKSEEALWNGPMGKYEDGYVEASVSIAKSIAESNTYGVSGGGDTSTVILEQRLEDVFQFISTAGGAMLDFLVERTLPGIEVVLKKKD